MRRFAHLGGASNLNTSATRHASECGPRRPPEPPLSLASGEPVGRPGNVRVPFRAESARSGASGSADALRGVPAHAIARKGKGAEARLGAGSIVQFENVGLRYGTGAETLSDLSFSLREGGFYFLTGPSGAGKTSLLRLLYLAQRPSRGLIRLVGEDIVTMPRKRLPGFRCPSSR